MDIWQKMIFPVRRVWIAVSTRVKSRKNGGGLLKLHNDVQTCEYQDVQVMWEMLRRSESEQMMTGTGSSTPTKRKQQQHHQKNSRLPAFWRVFVLSNHHHNQQQQQHNTTSSSTSNV